MLDFLTSPWVLTWLGVGAMCALVLTVTAYLNGTFEPRSSGAGTVWDEAVDRTAHALMLALTFALTTTAGPLAALALTYNYRAARQDALANEAADNAEF